jgi:uridine kinase
LRSSKSWTCHGSYYFLWYNEVLAHKKELRLTFLQDSFYKSLTPEQNALAHTNEYDLDSPKSIDFDLLVEKLKELKQGFVCPVAQVMKEMKHSDALGQQTD